MVMPEPLSQKAESQSPETESQSPEAGSQSNESKVTIKLLIPHYVAGNVSLSINFTTVENEN